MSIKMFKISLTDYDYKKFYNNIRCLSKNEKIIALVVAIGAIALMAGVVSVGRGPSLFIVNFVKSKAILKFSDAPMVITTLGIVLISSVLYVLRNFFKTPVDFQRTQFLADIRSFFEGATGDLYAEVLGKFLSKFKFNNYTEQGEYSSNKVSIYQEKDVLFESEIAGIKVSASGEVEVTLIALQDNHEACIELKGFVFKKGNSEISGTVIIRVDQDKILIYNKETPETHIDILLARLLQKE